MAESNKPFSLTVSKSGSSVKVYVHCNSPNFTWIKAITLQVDNGAWTFREGDSQQGFYEGRSGLLDPGQGGYLFVTLDVGASAKQASATAVYVELSSREFGPFKLN